MGGDGRVVLLVLWWVWARGWSAGNKKKGKAAVGAMVSKVKVYLISDA